MVFGLEPTTTHHGIDQNSPQVGTSNLRFCYLTLSISWVW